MLRATCRLGQSHRVMGKVSTDLLYDMKKRNPNEKLFRLQFQKLEAYKRVVLSMAGVVIMVYIHVKQQREDPSYLSPLQHDGRSLVQ
jgi:hypothetical protein